MADTPPDYTVLPVKLLRDDAQPPQRTRAQDAAFDLRCADAFTLAPGERRLVATGIAIALPEGVAGLVIPRSGLSAKHGITVVNAPGLIDPSYRGEIKIILLNTGTEPFSAQAGDRVAQLMLTPFLGPAVQIVEDLPESADGRGVGGFGSSGVA